MAGGGGGGLVIQDGWRSGGWFRMGAEGRGGGGGGGGGGGRGGLTGPMAIFHSAAPTNEPQWSHYLWAPFVCS